jgi:hypothetical protein
VSPILVRPVREQLEHDRVIRLLQVKLKKRQDVVTNIGNDQTVPVKIGQVLIYPDLVITAADRGKKLLGTVEVETAESVNHLEAMAQWAHLGRARAPFHLYVPSNCIDIARRLAAENHVNVAELWSFHTIGDQTRFTLVHKATPAEMRKAGGPRVPGAPPAEKTILDGPAAKKPVTAKKKAASKATPRVAKAAAKAGAAARKAK